MPVAETSEQPKAIVFDLGNVLLTSDYAYNTPDELRDFCDHFGVTMDNMDTAFSVFFPPYSLGKMTEDEYWKEYLYAARAKNPDVEAAKRIYRGNQKEVEQMLTLTEKLAGNYQLGILSTIPREWLDFKRERFGFGQRFNPIVSSGHTGLAKPDPAIYRHLLSELRLTGPEVLFMDDKATTLPPAQALGINTILFRGQQDLEVNLRQRGIRVN